MKQNTPGKYLYEYAVIRILPKVEREEFINAGIILFSKRAGFLKCSCYLNEDKIKVFSTEWEFDTIRKNLEVFDQICSGHHDGGPVASLDTPERFRWLTAVRSSSIQTSRPHPGFTDDLDKTLQKLMEEFVL